MTDEMNLTTIPERFPALGDGHRITFADAFGDGSMSVEDLDRVSLPQSGGREYEHNTGGDEKEPLGETFDAVILATRPRQAWRAPIDEKGNRESDESCSSEDGVTGVTTPDYASKFGVGGDCRSCPQFRRDCKSYRRMLLMREGKRLPSIMDVPPGSLRAVSHYIEQLYDADIGLWEVVTRFALSTRTRRGTGERYQAISPVMTDLLPDGQRERLGTLRGVARDLLGLSSG